MKCIRLVSLMLLASLVSVAAASAADLRSEAVAVSGVYSVAFNVNLASAVPFGSKLLCRARIVPNALFFNGLDRSGTPAGAGVATINGSTATCWVEIPFAWTQNDSFNGAPASQDAALSYEIEAVSDSASMPSVLRASSGQGIGVAYPSVNGSSRLSLNVTF